MAKTCIFTGDAPAIIEVQKATVGGTIEATDVFTLTINGKSISFTATTTTIAHVVAGLVAAWNGSTIPEFAEITAADASPDVTLTANVSARPFTVTADTTDGGGADTQTLVVSTVTAGTGPYHYDDVDNWVDEDGAPSPAIPVATDTVWLMDSAVDIRYGLDQSAVTLAALHIMKSYTGMVGLPRRNAGGYAEYRDTYLQAPATKVYIGQGPGSGSPRLKLDTAAVQTAVLVDATGTAEDAAIPAVVWKGTHAANVMTVNTGDAGVAFFGGEVATLNTLHVGFASNVATDSTVHGGAGLTLDTITIEGGSVELNNNVTTLVMQLAGELDIRGTSTVSTLRVDGGTTYYRSVGTVSTLLVSGGGSFDCRRDGQARTVTTATVYEGGTIRDPAGTVTWSNGIIVSQSQLGGVTIETGEGLRWTPSST